MAGKSRRRTIILLPFICLVFFAGWILSVLGSSAEDGKSIGAGLLTRQAKLSSLQRQFSYAIIEQREGIMLGFLGVFALTPFILFGGFPSWMYVSAGFFAVLGSVTMAHGTTRKNMIKAQLLGMTR